MEQKTKITEYWKSDLFVIKTILPYLVDIAIALCVLFVLFLFFFRIAIIEGSSMYDTLVHNDYVLLLNSSIAGEPEQGDIIVASKTTYENGAPIIKRVIATEGQKVDINFETGVVSVDGIALDEPYIHSKTDDFEGIYFPLVVEEGCIFVLGDNRGVSQDSRHPKIGQIDKREIVGKAIFLIFPGVNPATDCRQYDRIGVIS